MISDDEYLQLLEKYNFSFKIGDLVKGVIAGYDKDNLIVDIKAKSFAICSKHEILTNDNADIKEIFKLNDEFEFIITYKNEIEDIYYLSHKKVALNKNFRILKEKYKNNETIEGTITNITKGGILVNVMGIKGFVPLSQIKIEPVEVGNTIELKVLSFDDDLTNFIFSNKKVYQDTLAQARKEIFENIELNMVVKGRVARLVEFGAFVDIGGIEALLPLSQISHKWIDKPQDVLKYDDKIDVEIIGIDNEKQRISLSLKSLSENPWAKAEEFLKDKTTIKGKVTAIKPFGAFVEVYPDVEGLINNNQMQEYFNKYNCEINVGLTIDVEIKRFDIKNQKIILKII